MEMLTFLLTGGAIPGLLLLCGGFFWIYLRGGPFRHPVRMLRSLTRGGGEGGASPRRALLLALAGTLGVGNLVGVANAIWLGGAGAVFWMWVSALVAMILKYAEVLLAVTHQRAGRDGLFGGAYYYIKDAFRARHMKRAAAVVSGVFSVLMILDALSTGCVVQTNAVASAFSGVFSIPPWVIGVLLALLSVPLLLRGVRGIAALTEVLVPLMTLGYLLLSVAVLILRREALGEAFGAIFREAFSRESIGGGVLGFLTSRALRVGTMRGLLSNEAGCGTAPTAHASAACHSAAGQGVLGIVEVFVDTILLCTATALVILVSYPEVGTLGENAMLMSIRAYSSVLGAWSERFFCAAVFCFAWATLLCWGSYGMESLAFLSDKTRWKRLYALLFGGGIIAGTLASPGAVFFLSDLSITALTVINLFVLLLLRREVRGESIRWERDE